MYIYTKLELNCMPFEKGHQKTGGKKLGTPNKLTTTVKERVLNVFNELQDDPQANLLSWAKVQPTEFYKIASKLIPTEVKANVEVTEKQVFKIGNIEVEF